MKNNLIMASLLAGLAAAPVMAQTEEVPQKKTETAPNTVARSPEQRMKVSTTFLARHPAVNARRRL